MNETLRLILGFFVPHSLVELRRRRFERKWHEVRQIVPRRPTFDHAAVVPAERVPFSHASAIDFLLRRGLAEDVVRAGSMPEESLNYCAAVLASALDLSRPVTGVHVGNFLGVSLTFFTDLLLLGNRESVMLGIDPNISHRGVDHPQDHVMALLSNFGLQGSCVVTCGYSGSRNAANDGGDVYQVPGDGQEGSGDACEFVIRSLSRAGVRPALVVLDGNHDGKYLEREIEALVPCLAPDAVIILDDVNDSWADVQAYVVRLARARGFELIGRDGRVGIVQRRGQAPRRAGA